MKPSEIKSSQLHKNDWTCNVTDKDIRAIDQVWIVFDVDGESVVVKQWYQQKEIAVRTVHQNELRRLTFLEFIRVLSNKSNEMIIRN